MRSLCRAACVVMAIAAAGTVAGCDSLESLTLWDSKKPLPGERKPVFPGGVPGVAQGIPQELMPGYKTPDGADPAAQAAAAAAKEEETKSKPTAPKRVARPKPAAVAPVARQATAVAPVQSDAPAQAQQAQSQSPAWPSAPASGSFSR